MMQNDDVRNVEIHRDCAKCRRDILIRPRFNPYHITCAVCDKYFHVFCVFAERYLLNDIALGKDWYTCPQCKIDIFPLQKLSKFEFKRTFFLNDISDFEELPDFLTGDFFNNYGINESIDEGPPLNINSSSYYTTDSMHKKLGQWPVAHLLLGTKMTYFDL